MFVTVSRPPVTLAGDADPVIQAMVNLLPDYSSGRRLHELYVNKLQSLLPGHYSQLFGTGPAFRTVFYPSWRIDPLWSLAGETGLDDRWWSDFSVVVLCQAIRELGSDIRGQMLTDKINADVTSYNATLRDRSARAYARVLGATFEPLVALVKQVDPATAKQRFHDSLLDNVLTRQLWYQAGVWTSPDWEMFNQYAKYIVLGASDAEVDALIDELAAAGLPIPSQVGTGGWRSYAEELRDKPAVDLDDIRAACAGPIAVRTILPSFGGGIPATMPNGNCYEFTASGMPGNPYRRPPGGCCFTGDTQVLDADGTGVRLAELGRGDTVLTRAGVATVAYLARPLRSGRPLFRVAGGGPVFTSTHPFLNAAATGAAAGPPALLAVDPAVLAADVPTLSEDGIGRLEEGSMLYSRVPGRHQPTVPVTITGVEPGAETGDEGLYDLRLELGPGRRQEFWAGDGQRFYLVSPESPVLDRAGPAAATVVALMEGLLAADGPEGSGWPGWIVPVVNRFGPGVFLQSLMEALATTPSYGAPQPDEPTDERIDRLYQAMSTSTAETGAVVASLFDGLLAAVGQWLASLVALGWRNSTLLSGDVLAVTVFDVALTPANPVPAGAEVRLDVTVTGRTGSEGTHLWNRRGRENTRFHHYFDQLVHVDLTGEDRPAVLEFALQIHGAPIPMLFAEVPDPAGTAPHTLRSALLRDSAGGVVGEIRLDTRRLGRDAVSSELLDSGLWTEDAATAYANALGASMIAPVLWKLRALAPVRT